MTVGPDTNASDWQIVPAGTAELELVAGAVGRGGAGRELEAPAPGAELMDYQRRLALEQIGRA